ncbi:MAG: hypothetical protein LQ342_004504 [Letrouitia transgressa]|nr:MAG: hypothetical protein LQ342_004504 [Letrouitia transgressa]
MNRPLSRRQTFRQSLSDHAKSSLPSLVRSSTIFFDSKKENWPEPEKSIGRPCELLFKNTECWEVVGPVLDIFNKIAPAIDKLIEDNQELLEQGEPKSRGISFAMWMEGSKPSSARPVIVFCSRSRRQRSYAKALLKESSILDKHPGVSIKALDKMPAIRHAQSLKSHLSSSAASRLDIFMTDPSSEPFGAQITFGDSEAATMLGMVYLNGKQHALIPQHPRFDHYDEELDVLPDKEELLEFDEDSDMDETVLIEITSNASISSSEPSDIDDTLSPQSDEHSVFEAPHITRSRSIPATSASKSRPTLYQEPNISALHDCAGQNVLPKKESKSVKLATLSPTDSLNELDYECISIDEVELRKPNKILLSTAADGSPEYLLPREVATKAEQCEVVAVTGTTGLVMGNILESPYYIKLSGLNKCQEMWPVRLSRDTMPGDCGAWIINAKTGLVFGHIAAGDPHSGMAYIIPAYKVFADIERRFGAQPLLWSSDTDSQLAATNASNESSCSMNVVEANRSMRLPPTLKDTNSSKVEDRLSGLSDCDTVMPVGDLPSMVRQEWVPVEMLRTLLEIEYDWDEIDAHFSNNKGEDNMRQPEMVAQIHHDCSHTNTRCETTKPRNPKTYPRLLGNGFPTSWTTESWRPCSNLFARASLNNFAAAGSNAVLLLGENAREDESSSIGTAPSKQIMLTSHSSRLATSNGARTERIKLFSLDKWREKEHTSGAYKKCEKPNLISYEEHIEITASSSLNRAIRSDLFVGLVRMPKPSSGLWFPSALDIQKSPNSATVIDESIEYLWMCCHYGLNYRQQPPPNGQMPIARGTYTRQNTNSFDPVVVNSSREGRRRMLATEPTESLRKHLLWKRHRRQQKSTTANAILKQKLTTYDVGPYDPRY